MTDPRTLAQREGPEAMEALVRRLFENSGNSVRSPMFYDVTAAARNLAEPEPVTPVWPTGKLWARFIRRRGEFSHIGNCEPIDSPEILALPCRVVPASSVVLTREEARQAQELLTEATRYRGLGVLTHLLRAALRREREAQ
jgi:hypothetical protein